MPHVPLPDEVSLVSIISLSVPPLQLSPWRRLPHSLKTSDSEKQTVVVSYGIYRRIAE